MREKSAPTIPDAVVDARGDVEPESIDYARARVAAVRRHAHEPVLFARAKLTQFADPALKRPALAQANLDVNGIPVSVRVAAEDMTTAIDLMHDRLVSRLDRVARHWEARRGATAGGEHEWRHGDEPTHRPDYFPRPVEEREIVRHKAFTLAVESVDEAAFDMDNLDYDFHLFTDVECGRDAVVYHGGPTGYRVAYAGPAPTGHSPTAVELSTSRTPAPELAVAEAINRLENAGMSFVFFVNPDSGRGNVLYRRYDGHYGLITPSTE